MRAVLVAIALAALAVEARAQALEVRVVQSDGRTPAAGVLLEVRAADGSLAARGLARADGGWHAALPGAGRYRLLALRVGYRPVEVAVVAAAQATVPVRVTLHALTIALPEVRVAAVGRCGARAHTDSLAMLLWEEARKALVAAQLAAAEPAIFVIAFEYRALASADGLPIPGTRTGRWREAFSARPFAAVPPAIVAVEGYAPVLPTGTVLYRAPDVEHLLADAFAERHCVRSVAGPAEHPEWVGLAFEPVARPRRTGIAGTLWLDRRSAELREVAFRWVNLPVEELDVAQGGRVSFRALPTGHWIVDAWEIRMPRPGERALTVTGGQMGWAGLGERVLYTNGGPWLDEPPTPRSRLALRCGERGLDASWGLLEGVVAGADGKPLPGVRVEVEYRDGRMIRTLELLTDEDGSVAICGIPVGALAKVQARAGDLRADAEARVARDTRVAYVELALAP